VPTMIRSYCCVLIALPPAPAPAEPAPPCGAVSSGNPRHCWSLRQAYGSCRDPRAVPAVALDELVRLLRSPGTGGVRMHRGGVVEQRLHDPPALLDAVLAREVRAVADQRRV